MTMLQNAIQLKSGSLASIMKAKMLAKLSDFKTYAFQGIPVGADKGKPGQGIGALRRARNGLGYGN